MDAILKMAAPEWRTVRLGDVLTLHYGKALPNSYRDPNGKIPVYGANGIKDYAGKSLCDGPTLVIGRKGSAGQVTRVEGAFWPLDVAYYTSHDVSQLDFDYMAYALSMLDLPSLARGVKPGINRNDIYAIEVRLPLLDEQKRIVAVLDQAFSALDRARVHAQANLADAEQFFVNSLRAVFSNDSTKWASADVLPIASSRSSTASKKRTKASTQTGGREATSRRIEGDYSLCVLRPEVGARPGWRWSSLCDLARLESGHTPSRKHPEYWGGTLGWLGIRDARDHHGGEIFETSEQTNDLGIANSSARILPAGTVCLSRTASVGYVVKMGRAMSTSQDFVNWICGDELEPDFLMLLLLAQGEDILRFASGSVHQTIYFPEVKAFHICHPSIALQREICASFKATKVHADSLIERYNQKLADLAELRQSLLQKGFSGQLT